MPIIYVEKTITQTLRVADGFKCDVCKKTYSEAHYVERQEALHWTNHCGYGSVFGDGSVISLSICQSCLHDKFGEYINIEKDWEEGYIQKGRD